MISIGKHRAVCRSAQLGYSSTGKEQVALDFTITAGPESGQSITLYKFFTPAALKNTVKDLRTLGWTGSDPSTIPEGGFPNEVELVIEHEEYDGKTRAKVKFINAIGGGMKNKMDATQRRSFGQSMAQQIAALSTETTGTFDGGGGAPSTNDPDDGLPFASCTLSDRDPIQRGRGL